MTTGRDHELRAGAMAVLPMLIGVVPFGLVAGATPVEQGFDTWTAIGFSTIIFAGASQLAAIDVLASGGSWLIAVVAACTINLRLLLYSASLAPHLAHTSLRERLAVAYLLTDQAYAVSIARWSSGTARPSLAFYFGGALTLWTSWQVSTVLGALGGGLLSDDVPLEFAVPLVFLVLLVPAVRTPPAVAAVVGAAVGSIAALELGAGDVYILTGAITGIAAGALAEVVSERRTPMTEADL